MESNVTTFMAPINSSTTLFSNAQCTQRQDKVVGGSWLEIVKTLWTSPHTHLQLVNRQFSAAFERRPVPRWQDTGNAFSDHLLSTGVAVPWYRGHRKPQLGKYLFMPLYFLWTKRNQPVRDSVTTSIKFIMLTCPCNEHPLTPHFHILKLGYTGVCIFSSPEPKGHRWAYSMPMVRLPSSTISNIFFSETAWSIKAKSYVELKFVRGIRVTWPRWPPRPYIVKTSKSSTPEPVDRFPRDLVFSIGDQPIIVCSNDDPGLTST